MDRIPNDLQEVIDLLAVTGLSNQPMSYYECFAQRLEHALFERTLLELQTEQYMPAGGDGQAASASSSAKMKPNIAMSSLPANSSAEGYPLEFASMSPEAPSDTALSPSPTPSERAAMDCSICSRFSRRIGMRLAHPAGIAEDQDSDLDEYFTAPETLSGKHSLVIDIVDSSSSTDEVAEKLGQPPNSQSADGSSSLDDTLHDISAAEAFDTANNTLAGGCGDTVCPAPSDAPTDPFATITKQLEAARHKPTLADVLDECGCGLGSSDSDGEIDLLTPENDGIWQIQTAFHPPGYVVDYCGPRPFHYGDDEEEWQMQDTVGLAEQGYADEGNFRDGLSSFIDGLPCPENEAY